jgi:hypothetical protein
MQFHKPSVAQAPLRAPELEVVVPTAVEAADVPVAGEAEVVAATAIEAAGVPAAGEVASLVASAAELVEDSDATVAKTPPWSVSLAVDVSAVDVTTGEVEAVTWGAAVDDWADSVALDTEPPAVEEAAELTALAQEPVGVERADDVCSPSCSTESPGSGNRRSVESTVPQPLPILATNMFGRAS